MPNPDARRWNKRYAVEGKDRISNTPSRLLVQFAHLLPKQGLALDAACGLGNNGRYLATTGLVVIGLDISIIGLTMAVNLSRQQNLPFYGAVIDLNNLWLPKDNFDLIINFRYLERSTLPMYQQALKPGGMIIYETFVTADQQIEHPEYYLRPGELLKAFAQYIIIYHAQKPEKHRVMEQFIARKPHSNSCSN